MIFNKQQYFTGDKCEVRLICDNSNCSSAVKSFKIKLERKIIARGGLIFDRKDTDSEVLKTSKYLYQFKDTNTQCGPK